MNPSIYDAIVIGAGQAGLSISYQLMKYNLNHIVFEQGKIGESWRSQRWESFRLNTANKLNILPGQENIFPDPEGFSSAPEFVSFLEGYSKTFKLPVVENCRVLSLEKVPALNYFSVCVSENDSVKYYRGKLVIVASGAQNRKNIPSFAKNISPAVIQLHACDYRKASFLPDGAVLVVGSAQSGVQVAEDLIETGRKVFISTSKVARLPRRYRGKDIVDWLLMTGFYDVRTVDVTDPQVLMMRQPQISGTGVRGHTLSLQLLARNGAVILGKIKDAYDLKVFLQPDAGEHVKFGDEFSIKVKTIIDEFIQKSQLPAPPPDEDIADDPDETATCASNDTSLDLLKNNITSIIWTTGFTGDFSYLKVPVLVSNGMPKHFNGISDVEGLYFLGLPWMRKRKSGIILGIKDDADYLIEKILRHLKVIS